MPRSFLIKKKKYSTAIVIEDCYSFEEEYSAKYDNENLCDFKGPFDLSIKRAKLDSDVEEKTKHYVNYYARCEPRDLPSNAHQNQPNIIINSSIDPPTGTTVKCAPMQICENLSPKLALTPFEQLYINKEPFQPNSPYLRISPNYPFNATVHHSSFFHQNDDLLIIPSHSFATSSPHFSPPLRFYSEPASFPTSSPNLIFHKTDEMSSKKDTHYIMRDDIQPSNSISPAEIVEKINKTKVSPSNIQEDLIRYKCSDCNKSYSTISGFTDHKEFNCSTGSKKSFSCKSCEKTYVSLGALKMHIRTHTLPCKCNLCGKAFSRPWLLQGHMRTHTGEKPFSCPNCSRCFADRSNLRAHLQTHSGIKKYNCGNCSKTFSRLSLLIKHQNNCNLKKLNLNN